MNKINRKQFIQILAVGGGAAAALKFGYDRLSAFEEVSETRLLMGTVVNLTVIADTQKAAAEGLSAALDKMEALEAVLSQYLPSSQLSRLNTSGMIDSPDAALVEVLTEALSISALTNGTFDITIKPVLDLYKNAAGMDLSETAVSEALALVDYQAVNVSASGISFGKPGMQITVDGIAKGYIVDQAVSELKTAGLTNVLVEAGGDLMASGEKEPGSAWTVGVQSPRGEMRDLLTAVDLSNKAAATSGDYMQAFSDDFSLHHIIDPRTGISAPELAGTTVIADSTMMADALATALMVMGPKEGLAAVEALPDVEAFAVGKDLTEYQTSGFSA